MNVVEVSISNIFGVKKLKALPLGHHLVLVGGKNGEGKSSALNALMLALVGKQGWECPDVVLKEGANEGSVSIKVDGCESSPVLGPSKTATITRHVKKTKSGNITEKVVITDEDGNEAGSPTALLKDLLGSIGYDPIKFLQLTPVEQANTLQKLVGIDFAKLDEEYDAKFAERTLLTRERDKLAASVEASEKELAAEFPDLESLKRVDVSELLTELQSANVHNQGKDKLTLQWKELARKVQDAVHAETAAKDDFEATQEEIKQLEGKLDRLKSSLVTKQAHIEELQTAVDDLKILQRKVEEQGHAFVSKDTDAIQSQIANAGKINAGVDKKHAIEAKKVELKSALDKVLELTNRLQEINTTKKEAIENAALPIPDLSFNKNGVYLKGIPLRQCSTAEQIRIALEVVASTAGELNVIISHRGESLDDDSLKIAEEICKRKGCQLWIEYVTHNSDDEKKCQVVFKNGIGETQF